MKTVILITSALNISFLLLHELDAFHRGEWKMFGFLNKLKEKYHYTIFLWLHFPICIFLLYYFWTVFTFSNFRLWIIMNIFGIFHLIIHLIALKWKSNVFLSFSSIAIISATALTGLINLLVFNYYTN